MGQGDARNACLQPGVKLVAACDVYDGRLRRMKEVYGRDILTTRDYREVLARRDVDAVLIATPDHWHAQMTIEALEAGKHVYCQKPMVQRVEEGLAVIAAEKKSGKVLQVGSQYVSSQVFQKARDLYAAGAIGEMNLVEAWLDRNTSLGAWRYTIPPNLERAQVDWEQFLGRAPKREYEPMRLFRWRNYGDYGTGVAGDLFVHLLSGLHTVTGSKGPRKVFAAGGVRYWKDGRDAPDVMHAVLDYGTFTLALRVNLASGLAQEQFGLRFVGNEGVMTAGFNLLRLEKSPRDVGEPGHTVGTWAERDQELFLKEYRKQYPVGAGGLVPTVEEQFGATANAHLTHHQKFYESVTMGKKSVEDGTFGFRAAGPALLCNESVEKGEAMGWDPVGMRRV